MGVIALEGPMISYWSFLFFFSSKNKLRSLSYDEANPVGYLSWVWVCVHVNTCARVCVSIKYTPLHRLYYTEGTAHRCFANVK